MGKAIVMTTSCLRRAHALRPKLHLGQVMAENHQRKTCKGVLPGRSAKCGKVCGPSRHGPSRPVFGAFVYQVCGWGLAGMSQNQSMAQVRRWEAQTTEESIPLHQAPGVHLSVPLLISEEHG